MEKELEKFKKDYHIIKKGCHGFIDQFTPDDLNNLLGTIDTATMGFIGKDKLITDEHSFKNIKEVVVNTLMRKKTYRKVGTIKILYKTAKGYMVWDGVNKHDQWEVDDEFFKKNYEEVK